MKHYILDENKEPQEVDALTWALTFGDLDTRKIKQSWVAGTEVSTVFLGLDHNFSGEGPPVLFETLVMGDVWDGEMWRYCNYEDALRHHEEVVVMVRDYTEVMMEGMGHFTMALGDDGIEFK